MRTNLGAKILERGDLRGELMFATTFSLVACAYSECRTRIKAAAGEQRKRQSSWPSHEAGVTVLET